MGAEIRCWHDDNKEANEFGGKCSVTDLTRTVMSTLEKTLEVEILYLVQFSDWLNILTRYEKKDSSRLLQEHCIANGHTS